MAPTIVGTDEVTSLSRRIILPFITDLVYGSNALLYRLNSANRRNLQGGTHIEVPFIVSKPTNGGAWDGAYEVVDVSPWETTINGAFEIKDYQHPLTIDRRTLRRMDSPLAIANVLRKKAEEAKMHLADLIGTDLSQSEGSSDTVAANQKKLTGLKAVIDDTTNTANYGELSRSTYTELQANLDAATATLTMTALESLSLDCQHGGHAPTLIRSRKEQYQRYWSLNQAMQRFPVGEAGSDMALASAGFRNLLFDNIPWIIDDKVMDGPNSSNSRIEFLCEDVIELYTYQGGEFEITDWRVPVNQPGAMTSFVLWNGEVICTNPQLQGALTAVTA